MVNQNCKKMDAFAERILGALLGNQTYSIEAQFHLTQHCNLQCPGCYMKSAPCAPKETIPSDDIGHYVQVFNQQKSFRKIVTFTGGEIFTTDLTYLARNIQQTLRQNIAMEIKTNGSWAADPKKSNNILGMIKDLYVPQIMNFTDQEIVDFIPTIPNYRALSRQEIYQHAINRFGIYPALSMAVSVDNLIHPKQSADWFMKIANAVTEDSKLANRVRLSAYSFVQSMPFFINTILADPRLEPDDLDTSLTHGLRVCGFKLNGRHIPAYFSDFVDTKIPEKPEHLSQILIPSDSQKDSRLIFFFRPDRTVGFETNGLQSVGRVPYIDKFGRYKSYDQLLKEMSFQMIDDYRRALSR